MPIQSRKIFIDSSVLISFVDRADQNHQKALRCMDNLARLGFQLYTSYQNIVETYVALSREIGQSVALEFLQASMESDMEVLLPQKADLDRSLRMLRANRDRQIPLREAVNATLMQRKSIMQILTFSYWHNLFGTYISNIAMS